MSKSCNLHCSQLGFVCCIPSLQMLSDSKWCVLQPAMAFAPKQVTLGSAVQEFRICRLIRALFLHRFTSLDSVNFSSCQFNHLCQEPSQPKGLAKKGF